MSNQTAVLDEQMVETESPQSPRAILSAPFEARSAEMPAWFRDQQQAAFARFEALPYPNRKEPAWLFSNVNALDLSRYNFGASLSQAQRDDILERSSGLNDVDDRVILACYHL